VAKESRQLDGQRRSWLLNCTSSIYLSFRALSDQYRSGYDRFMAMMQNGDRLRDARKYLQREVGPQRAKGYASEQQVQVVRFLRKLVDNPDEFEEHCKWSVDTLITLNLDSTVTLG
jgi:cytochrome P450